MTYTATDYDIAVANDGNGTIATSKTSANKNDDITVTATPNSGYALNTVTVTRADEVDGPSATVTGNSATFVMPASNVTVTATFTTLAPPADGDATEATAYAAVVSGKTTYYYSTLKKALDNWNTGRTVKLVKAIDATTGANAATEAAALKALSKPYVIDLNGKELKVASGTKANGGGITISSDVALSNSGTAGGVTVTGTSASDVGISVTGGKASFTNVAVNGAAKLLDISGGELASTDSSFVSTNAPATLIGLPIVNVAGAKFTMKGGSIESKLAAGATDDMRGMGGLVAGGSATVTLGEEDGDGPKIDVWNDAIAVPVASTATIKVLSGTYKSSVTGGQAVNLAKKAAVEISGGTFTGEQYALAVADETDLALKVKGGTFGYSRAADSKVVNNAAATQIKEVSGGAFAGKANFNTAPAYAVSGGTFGAEITAGECAYGFAPVNDGKATPETYGVAKTLKGVKITVDPVTFDGSDQVPAIKVQWPTTGNDGSTPAADAVELEAGKDYDWRIYTNSICNNPTAGQGYVDSSNGNVTYYVQVTPHPGSDFLSTADAVQVSAGFQVLPANLADANVYLRDAGTQGDGGWQPAASYTHEYTGTAIQPEVKVTVGTGADEKTIASTNYATPTYGGSYANVNPCSADDKQASVTVTAQGGSKLIESSKTVYFGITGTPLQGASISLPANAKYDKAAHAPSGEKPTVTTASGEIVGTDDLTYTWYVDGVQTAYGSIGFTNAATYTVKVKPITGAANKYSGEAEASYSITPASLAAATGSLKTTEVTWVGAPIANATIAGYVNLPTSFKDGDTTFTVGTDPAATTGYIVSPETITKAGTYDVKLVGVGNFLGSEAKMGTLTVNKGSFDGMTALSDSKATYDDGKSLADTFAARITTFTKSNPAATYTLVKDEDYTLSFYAKTGESDGASTYDSAKPVALSEVGKYVMVATGTGSWTGSAQADVEVTGKAISDSRYNLLGTFTDKAEFAEMSFTGAPIDPNDYVKSIQLQVGTGETSTMETYAPGSYSVEPTEITGAGAVTLYITVNGDYAGTYKKSVTVKKATLSTAATASAIAGMSFDGAAKDDFAYTVTNKATGKELKEGTDYSVELIKAAELEDGTYSFDAKDNPTTVAESLAECKAIVMHAGHYRLVATGLGNYDNEAAEPESQLTTEFAVSKAKLSDVKGLTAASIVFGTNNADEFTGSDITPTPMNPTKAVSGLTLGENAVSLTFDDDYTVAAVKNVGTYELELEGKGDYEGKATQKFAYEVTPASIASTTIQFSLGNDQWVDGASGSANYVAELGTPPTIQVVLGDTVLKEGVDYTKNITGYNAESVAGGLVTIAPVAGGSIDKEDATNTAQFGVKRATLNGGTVALDTAGPVSYKGAEYVLTPTVKASDGTALATADFTLLVLDADGADISAKKFANTTQDGTGDTDKVVTTAGKVQLQNAGTYTVFAIGKNFAGSASASFKIEKLAFGDASIEDLTYLANGTTKIEDAVYTGNKVTLELSTNGTAASTPTLQFGNAADANVDLALDAVTAEYANNTSAGEATLTLTPKTSVAAQKANYEGSKTFEFEIAKANFGTYFTAYPKEVVETVTGVEKSYAFKAKWDFTGKEVNPELVVVKNTDVAGMSPAAIAESVFDGTIKALDASNYTEVYGENTAGGAPIVARAVAKADFANYEGSAALVGATVDKPAFNEEKLEVTAEDQVYTGEPIEKVVVKLKDGDYELEKNVDYYIGYKNNTEVGTATATLVSTGANFKAGTIEKTFQIVGADLKDAKITLSDNSLVYNGQSQQPKVTAVTLNGEPVKDFVADVQAGTNVGTYDVTVTSTDKNYSGSAGTTWSITKAKNAVTAKAAAATIAVKGSTTITSSGKGTVSYTSSNSKVATVDAKGKVTGKAAGTATITVSYKNDKNYADGSATVKVTVKKANAAKVTVAKGKTKKAAAKVKANKKATIAAAVTVKSAAGKVTVANKSTSKVAKSFKVNYKSGKVKVAIPKNKVKKGKTYLLKVQVKAAGNASTMPFTKTVNVYVKGTK